MRSNSGDRLLSKVFSFGSFRFLPEQQLLLDGDSPVRIGARALEILLLLVERSGEVVAKQELMSRVWPGLVVEESNLKVNVASLRRVLRDSPGQPQYIATVSGRGYRFVSPVGHGESPSSAGAYSGIQPGKHNLPPSVARLIGREETIQDVWRRSRDSRLLTIVGPGGIGKTSVALAVAAEAAAAYEDGAWLVDLAPLTNGAMIPGTIASALGLTEHSEDVIAALVGFLRDKHLMLIVDNCEHLVDTVAVIAEQLSVAAAGVHVVATSREPLRAKAEMVYRLAPLDIPPDSGGLTAAAASTFAAVELFVERAAKNAGEFTLSDANAPIVGDICRALDGIALAIELAATRVYDLGVQKLRTALTDRLGLLNQSQHMAPARQRTLYATLDWSYQLLTEGERVVLQRLSLFASSFDLKACVAIAASNTLERYHVIDALANLVAKSLVSVSLDLVAPYRLLETTRAFARDRLIERKEFARCAMKHAEYFRDELRRVEEALLRASGMAWTRDTGIKDDERAALAWAFSNDDAGMDLPPQYARTIDDVRAALAWALSGEESLSIGISLVVEAIPLWTRMSLLEERRESVERVLFSLACRARMTDRDRMTLNFVFAKTLLYTRGPEPRVEDALSEAERLAERLGNGVYLTRILRHRVSFAHYSGDRRSTLDLIHRMERTAESINDSHAARGGRRLGAMVLCFMGHHDIARNRLELVQQDAARLGHYPSLQFMSAHTGFAYILFVQGLTDQARQKAESAVNEVMAGGKAVPLSIALALTAIPIALYRGDLVETERFLSMLTDLAASHGLVIWVRLAECFHSILLIKKGEGAGVYSLRRNLADLRATYYGHGYAALLGFLAQGLGGIGERAEAFNTIETAIGLAKRQDDLWCLAELLRIKGWLLHLDRLPASNRAAETYLMQALEVARCQSALTWELRAAIDLAKIWRSEGRLMEARRFLQPIFERFTEGFDTVDLRAARAFLRDPGGKRVRTPPGRRKRNYFPQGRVLL